MTDFVSVLLVATQDTRPEDLHCLSAYERWLKHHGGDFELQVILNGCDRSQLAQITQSMAHVENGKLLQLNALAEPDAAILEGLQRTLGDLVLVAPLGDFDAELLGRLIRSAEAGHEVVIAAPHGITEESVTYGLRLLSRAAIHFVLQSGPSRKGAYHQVARHPLFNPERVAYRPPIDPKSERVLGLRRRWRALFASQTTPLRIVSVMALGGAGLNLLYSGYVMAIFMMKADIAPGWATLSLQSSGMFFLFSLALFVLCEYLIHVIRAFQVQRTPRIAQEIRSRTVSFNQHNLEHLQ